jgi:1-acyl-sn-glycerol-3-phosphate acyltransferase
VDVLPVAVTGTGAIWPVAGFRHVRGGPIRVRIGAPIPVRDADGTPVPRQVLAQRAQDSVQAMLQAPA